jgi:hypothetical protein
MSRQSGLGRSAWGVVRPGAVGQPTQGTAMAEPAPKNTPSRQPVVQPPKRWYVPSRAKQQAAPSVRVTAVHWATTTDLGRRTALGRVVMALRDEAACQNVQGACRSVLERLDEVP